MSTSGLPFDDIRTLCRMLPPPDGEALAEVRSRRARLGVPAGALGRLEGIVEWLAGWQGNALPRITRPLVAIFAGSHGVAADPALGLSDSLAPARLAHAAAGGAAINQICATHDIGLKVFELALPLPTRDITGAAALDERDCTATIAFGMEAIAGGTDLVCIGEIGTGNEIAAAAMLAALFGGSGADWLDARNMPAGAVRIAAVDRALALHHAAFNDPLEILRRLGGREIAAALGAILAARIQRIPVVLDSLPVLAAAAVLHGLHKDALDHCLVGQATGPVAHKVLAHLALKPLLDLGVTIGEGAGAALAVGIIRAAVACHAGMARLETPAPLLN